MALAVAAWIRYASGRDEAGAPIDVADPLHPTFARLATAHGDNAEALADAFIDLRPVFGDLADDLAFRAAVRGAAVALFDDGARAALARFP